MWCAARSPVKKTLMTTLWTWRWWRHLPNVIRLPTLGRCVAKYFPSWQIRCAFPNSIVIFLVWPTIDLWKPNATALPMALCVSFSFDYFQSFAMTTFFVYINYIAPRIVKTYMHCMWSGRQSCVICFVCYRYTCVRVLLWLITTDCLRWATQRSWPLKLSAAIIMTTPVIDATN